MVGVGLGIDSFELREPQRQRASVNDRTAAKAKVVSAPSSLAPQLED